MSEKIQQAIPVVMNRRTLPHVLLNIGVALAFAAPADSFAAPDDDRARLIIAAVTKPDPRPVHVVVNAGDNTLAQALRDYRATDSAEGLKAFVAKLRVFENQAQDECRKARSRPGQN